MNAFDPAAATLPEKSLGNLRFDESRLISETDALFKGKATDFFSTYLNLSQLHERLNSRDMEIGCRTVQHIGSLLLKQAYDHQKQGYFLYREAAETLVDCIEIAGRQGVAREALAMLTHALGITSGDAHRAVAGALGSLPLSISGPELEEGENQRVPAVQYGKLLRQVGLEKGSVPDIVGRSLVIRYPRSGHILVLKMARRGDTHRGLQRESDWMDYLSGRKHAFVRRFDIPEPIKIEKKHVFRLTGIPSTCLPAMALHPERYAIGFRTIDAYFDYPNESCPEKRLGNIMFQEVMCRNAWILGRLASMGIVHDALIPLFHNRTQRGRRDDQGAYEWVRAGRLDRWLYSCEHPNIGVSGVRDFEHLVAFDGKNQYLYRSIGKHFISMLLVTGSYFRKKDLNLLGMDAGGQPADTRSLFEKKVLEKTVCGIFRNYYEGFTGTHFRGGMPFDSDTLIERMTAEMGVDRYMEERVRVADQQAMTDKAFRSFLADRGVEAGKIESFERGLNDIVIHSGPHLGDFNAPISLPELIESVASMAALCVSGKYWCERHGNAEG